MGKKFNKYGKARQLEEVKKILKDKSFISDMISLSGFKQIENIIHQFLQTNRTSFEIENVLYKIRSMKPISESFDDTIYSTQLHDTVSEYVAIYDQIKHIDISQYNIYMQSLLESILVEVDKILTRPSDGYLQIKYNDNLMQNIIYKYFASYYKKSFHENEYICVNPIIIEQAIQSVLRDCLQENSSIMNIICYTSTLKHIKQFDKKTIHLMLDTIIKNKSENKTFDEFGKSKENIQEFILACNEIKEQNIDIKPFLRFVILNKLKHYKYTADELFILHMMYQNNLFERPICNVIGMIRQHIITPPNIQLVIKGFLPEYADDLKFMIDAYYLSNC
jgi:hypothetical protein